MAAFCSQKTIQREIARRHRSWGVSKQDQKRKWENWGSPHKIPKPVICLEDIQS